MDTICAGGAPVLTGPKVSTTTSYDLMLITKTTSTILKAALLIQPIVYNANGITIIHTVIHCNDHVTVEPCLSGVV